jgi:hypothetical protein
MIFPQLARFTDAALLLLRLTVGIVFVTSGYKHLKDRKREARTLMSKSFTILLRASELAGGLGVISGVLAQPPPSVRFWLCSARSRRKSHGTRASGASQGRYISGDRDFIFIRYVPSIAAAHTLRGGKKKTQLRRQL